MSEQSQKIVNMQRRSDRTRAKLSGTSARPRLSINISNKHIVAQLINDEAHATLAAVDTSTMKLDKKTMTEKAVIVGEEIAKKASSKKIKAVVFDRGAKKYHGRIKALADAAREKGLVF